MTQDETSVTGEGMPNHKPFLYRHVRGSNCWSVVRKHAYSKMFDNVQLGTAAFAFSWLDWYWVEAIKQQSLKTKKEKGSESQENTWTFTKLSYVSSCLLFSAFYSIIYVLQDLSPLSKHREKACNLGSDKWSKTRRKCVPFNPQPSSVLLSFQYFPYFLRHREQTDSQTI